MNTAPRLSILVPAYNAQQHLDATLRSVLEQMGPDHELVVIDDGSTDATSQLARRLQAAYPALATS
jgi:glycosyltransferase involved in cell wall biosynthesis